MKRVVFLFLVTTFITAYSIETDCPHGCGDSRKDKRANKICEVIHSGFICGQRIHGDLERLHRGFRLGRDTNVELPWFWLSNDLTWPALEPISIQWDGRGAGHSVDDEEYAAKYAKSGLARKWDSKKGRWHVQWNLSRENLRDENDSYYFLVESPASINRVFFHLRRDCEFCSEHFLEFLQRLQDLCYQTLKIKEALFEQEGEFYWDRERTEYGSYLEDIENLKKNIRFVTSLREDVLRLRSTFIQEVCELQKEVSVMYFDIFDNCAKNHKSSRAFYERGLMHFEAGRFDESLEDILALINKAKGREELDKLPIDTYFFKGVAEMEVGLYHDAILSLNEALFMHPGNRDIYLERALAYFETGQFDEALSDYIFSGAGEERDTGAPVSFDFGLGIARGIKKGIQEEFGEMAPAWAPIASIGLWAFASSPPPAKYAAAVLGCVAAAGVYMAADQMVTELRELVTNWKYLSEGERGELTGYVIGKYGIEIFACYGAGKVMDSYHKLKRANGALTFEVMLTDTATAAAMKARYRSIEKFKVDQEFIRKTFGKKPYTEEEIRSFILSRGYLLPERPKGIPENFVTRFSDRGCGISYHDPIKPEYNSVRLMPGKPYSPNPAQQQPYVIQLKDGKALNIEGESVLPKSTAAHIPVEKYVYRP